MLNENRISEAQQKFLRTVRDGTHAVDALRHQLETSGKRFARWMRNPFFRRNLSLALLGLARQRFAVIELSANMAAQMLEKGVKGETLSAEVVTLCRTVIELAQKQRYGRRRRAKGKNKSIGAEERDLCHPNAKDREKELAQILGDSEPATENKLERGESCVDC